MRAETVKRAVGFILGFLILSVIHEGGHMAVGWATGAPIWEATVLHRRVFPFTLEPVDIPALYSITFGVPPHPLAEGLRAAGGCGATLLVALIAIWGHSTFLKKSRMTPFLDGLWLACMLGGMDLVTYAWIPLLGLPRWILFGARHSEPAVAAALLGISPLALHAGIGLVALGTWGAVRYPAPPVPPVSGRAATTEIK